MEIPGKPEDYFSNECEGAGYKANRGMIRELVARRNEKIQSVIKLGGNAYTTSLDLNDQFDDFISTLPAQAKVVVYETFTQEVNAASALLSDKTKQLNDAVVADKEKSHLVAQALIIVGIIAVAALVIINL